MAHLVTSIPSSALAKEQLGRVMADYLVLERARVFRRLLVTRFGLLILIAVAVSVFVPGLPTTAHWLPVVLFLIPPVWSVIVELRLNWSLSRRLDGVNGVTTREVSSTFELDDC